MEQLGEEQTQTGSATVAETEKGTRGGTAAIGPDGPHKVLAADGGLVVVATPGTDAAEGPEKLKGKRGRVAEDEADRKSGEEAFPRGETFLLPRIQDLCLLPVICPILL